MQAAINVQLAQEWFEIVSDLETLQRSCRGSDQAALAIVIFLIKARGVSR
jgi:hypothetical protein